MTGIEIFLLIAGCVFMIGSFFVSERLSASELNKIAELSESELGKIIDKGIQQAGYKIDDVIDDKVNETSELVERAMEKETNEKIMAISEYSDTVVDGMKRTHDEIMFLYSMLNDKHSELTSLTGDLQRLAASVRNLQERAIKQEEKRSALGQENAAKKTQATSREVMMPQEASQVQQKVTMPEITEQPPLVASVSEAFLMAEQEQFPVGETVAETFVEEIQEEILVQQEEDAVSIEEEEPVLENHNEMILRLHRSGMSKVDIARKLELGLGEVSLVIGLYKGDEE